MALPQVKAENQHTYMEPLGSTLIVIHIVSAGQDMLFNVGLWSPRGSALEPGESPTARFAALNDAAAIHDALQGKPRLGDVQRAALQQALADAAPGAHIDNIAPQWFDTGHLQEAQAKIHAASSEQYELQPVVGRE